MTFWRRVFCPRRGALPAAPQDPENVENPRVDPNPSALPCFCSRVLPPGRRLLSAARRACTNHAKAVFVLTPEERRVVMLVTILFIFGLAVQLARGCASVP